MSLIYKCGICFCTLTDRVCPNDGGDANYDPNSAEDYDDEGSDLDIELGVSIPIVAIAAICAVLIYRYWSR